MNQDETRIPESIRYSLMKERMVVVGAGGIGAWFVINVALSSDMCGTTLMVCDGDILEKTNLGRLPYPLSWVGKNKALALREFICGFMERSNRTIVDFQNHIDITTLKELNPTLIVDCCDNQIIQEQIKGYIRTKRGSVRYIRLAGDSGYITVTNCDEESYTGIGAGNNGYLVVPSWAGNVMLPAIFGFHALVKRYAVEINHKDIDEYLRITPPEITPPVAETSHLRRILNELGNTEENEGIVPHEAIQGDR